MKGVTSTDCYSSLRFDRLDVYALRQMLLPVYQLKCCSCKADEDRECGFRFVNYDLRQHLHN